MGVDLHRQAAHRRGDRHAGAIHVVDVFAADDGAHRQFAAQHAKLQIDAFLAVKALFDAVDQRRDADAFTGMGDQNFFRRLRRHLGRLHQGGNHYRDGD
jgi:hypothetical protein